VVIKGVVILSFIESNGVGETIHDEAKEVTAYLEAEG